MGGQCQHCGYDLAGLSGSSACPECGHRPGFGEPRRLQHPVSAYFKSIAFGALALFVIALGALVAVGSADPTRAMMITLSIAAVPAACGFLFWWLEWRGE